MESLSEANFKRNYVRHLQHLKLKGLQPKTIDAYARAICRIGARFDHQIDSLSEGSVKNLGVSRRRSASVPRIGTLILTGSPLEFLP